jgi:F-type H+/Na+-transporting ATPase subunit alpha
MSKFSKHPSLEETIAAVNLNHKDNYIPEKFEYDPFSDDNLLIQKKHKTSYSQLLDFSFPDEVEEGVTQVGEVIYIGDGVCKVQGLDKAKIEDIITVKTAYGEEKALILGIEETHVESVVLGEYSKIKQGDQVVSNNSRLTIPVGESMLGRIINPLGVPVDGKGAVKGETVRPVEFPAPSVMKRYPILDPLKTGVMVVDTTIPVGRGQRELIIGDRKTGKSRLGIDIICNQKGKNVFCFYVGVGIHAAKAKATVDLLESRGAMEYTTLIISTSSDPASLQYMAPYAGSALAEYFLYKGQHALIVYDDLSKQAKAYRQVSLLLKRSPGRDAYPGDIFFLHSRLLERSCKINPQMGAGSITTLPIAETQSGDVSDYIITNLMSITDGHIYLDAKMMHDGILPAVNSGTSVSRIGSKVQISVLKKVGEIASRALARYEEVKSFETMNTEVADETLKEIRRGKQTKEMLAQRSDLSMSYDEQVVMLTICAQGKLDVMELADITEYKDRFIKFYRENVSQAFIKRLETAKALEEIEEELLKYFDDYWKKYGKPKKKK